MDRREIRSKMREKKKVENKGETRKENKEFGPFGEQYGKWCLEFGSFADGPANLYLKEEKEAYVGLHEEDDGNQWFIFMMKPDEKQIFINLETFNDMLDYEEQEYIRKFWKKYEDEGWGVVEA